MDSYLAQKERVIEELNKQREMQKELITRKAMLAEYIEMNRQEFDDVQDRLTDIDTKIKDLRSKL